MEPMTKRIINACNLGRYNIHKDRGRIYRLSSRHIDSNLG